MENKKFQGKFIVIDGVDGSGKGEQLRLLQKKLPELYPHLEFLPMTREPGGSPFAESIRQLILQDTYAKDADSTTMIQLFGAARFDHLHKVVFPHLALGKIVICDRFDSSTYAYQLIAQSGGIDARKMFNLQRETIERDLPPWTTIILDVDVKTAMLRAQGREGQEKTHFDERSQAFHEAVRLGFKSYAEAFPEGVSFVDASRTIEEVHEDVLAIVRKVLD